MSQTTPAEQLQLAMAAARADRYNPEVWVTLGEILLAQTPPLPGRARECFTRALQLAPGHATAQQGMAVLAARLPAATPSPVAPPARLAKSPTASSPEPAQSVVNAVPTPVDPPVPVVSVAPQVPSVAGTCPQCGCPILSGATFCMMCGTTFAQTEPQVVDPPLPPPPLPTPSKAQPSASTLVCPQCASPLPKGTRFCTVCGTRLPKATDVPVPAEPSAPNYQPLAAATIVVLMEQMGNLDDAIAQSAARQLVGGGPTASPQLVEALGSGKGLFGTGKAAEQRRQWAMAALIEIGVPAIPTLLGALSNDNDKLAVGAAATLAQMGEPAVVPLIEALPKLIEGLYLPTILAKIGQPAVQPLVQFMRRVEPIAAGWNAADIALCAIVGAPTRGEINALEKRTKFPNTAFLVAGGFFTLVGTASSGGNVLAGLLMGLIAGYLAWAVAWCGYIGILAIIVSVFIAPFMALSHHLERKKKTKARLQFEATYLARTI